MHIWCEYVCFYEGPYSKMESFIALNPNDYYIGFILFVYTWIASLLLPLLLCCIAGKIKTETFAPKTLRDVMINGDIIGIFELDLFGVFKSNKHLSMQNKRRHVYTLTACNLDWSELDSDVLMQYLYILIWAGVDFKEIHDPYDENKNLMQQLCRNYQDCYRWIDIKQIAALLDKDCTNLIASCCQCGNFRIFKGLIKHFGLRYLRKNALIAIHYALHCLGTPFQQKQANRIIVYILKNTDVTIEKYVDSYKGSEEIGCIREMVKKKCGQIERIQREIMAKQANNQLNVSDNAELLQFQLSNNSIGSVEDEEEVDLIEDSYEF